MYNVATSNCKSGKTAKEDGQPIDQGVPLGLIPTISSKGLLAREEERQIDWLRTGLEGKMFPSEGTVCAKPSEGSV